MPWQPTEQVQLVLSHRVSPVGGRCPGCSVLIIFWFLELLCSLTLKNCVCVCVCMFSSAAEVHFLYLFCCLVTKLCPTLCDPMDCSQPGSSVCGILQARTLECVAISFSRGSSWPRDGTCISCISRQIVYHWATREVHLFSYEYSLKEEKRKKYFSPCDKYS